MPIPLFRVCSRSLVVMNAIFFHSSLEMVSWFHECFERLPDVPSNLISSSCFLGAYSTTIVIFMPF